jgi:hypothetical protein
LSVGETAILIAIAIAMGFYCVTHTGFISQLFRVLLAP